MKIKKCKSKSWIFKNESMKLNLNISNNQEKNIINITYNNNSNNIFNGIISYLGNGNLKSDLENKVDEIPVSSTIFMKQNHWYGLILAVT